MSTHPLSQAQRDVIERNFLKVAAIQDQAAALFYARLFELNPSLERLFPADLSEQGTKLMRAIGLLVNSLDRLDTVKPALGALGQRHVGYGVRDEHYEVVGQALLWTLGQGLGDDFDDEAAEAWTRLYVWASEVMRTAASESPAPLARTA